MIIIKNRNNKNGSLNNNWKTPDYIIKYIKKEFGNFFDPCPLKSKFDGLKIKWKKVNYINPPYTQKLKEAFIIKAYNEAQKNKICIMLIPSNTETKIFHNIIVPHAEIRLIKKRISFEGYNTKNEYVTNKTGQTGSMLIIFGKKPCIKTIEIKK